MEELHKTALNAINSEKNGIADYITNAISTAKFVAVMSAVITLWITFNIFAGVLRFDLYPFVFLNLVLACMAAYTGPFVMMTQSRQEKRDRALAEYDVQINKATEAKVEEILAVLNGNLEHSENTRHDIELIYEQIRGIHKELNTTNHSKRTYHV